MVERVVMEFRVPDNISEDRGPALGFSLVDEDPPTGQSYETYSIETTTREGSRIESHVDGVYHEAVDKYGDYNVDGVVLDAKRCGKLAAYFHHRAVEGHHHDSLSSFVSAVVGFEVYPVRNCGMTCEALVTTGKIAEEHGDPAEGF